MTIHREIISTAESLLGRSLEKPVAEAVCLAADHHELAGGAGQTQIPSPDVISKLRPLNERVDIFENW